jgi:outer membrane biogenesis lipoprotein LolB
MDMKSLRISLLVIAVASLVLSGCASEKASTTAPQADLTNKRVHTQEELQKTGQSDTGAALEKVDPAVRTSGRP